MASLSMDVCLPAGIADTRAAVAAAMAPFEREADGDHGMDRRIWDSAIVRGGGNERGFRIVAGAQDDPRLIYDDPVQGRPVPSLPGWCAGGPRGLLDLDWPQRQAEREAADAWDTWQHLLASQPPARPLTEFFAERQAGRLGYSTQNAINAHRDQPLIRALATSGVPLPMMWHCAGPVLVVEGSEEALAQRLDLHDAAVMFGVAKRDFVAGWRARAGRPGGVLTLDGWWCEPGELPVHATCPDRNSCPHLDEPVDHAADVHGYLAGLPDDVYIVSVRCHV